MFVTFAACILLSLGATPPLHAAPSATPSPWVGDWYLDYTTPGLGRPITLTLDASNHFRFFDPSTHDSFLSGQPDQPPIDCNNKPYRAGTEEGVCARRGDREIVMTSTDPAHTVRYVLSGDKELVVIPEYDPTAYNPLETLPETYYRLSKGTGFNGTWLSERYIGGAAHIEITEPLPGYLLMVFTQKDAYESGTEFLPMRRVTLRKDGIGVETKVEHPSPGVLRVTEKKPQQFPWVTTYTVKGNTLTVEDKRGTLVYHRAGR